MKKNMIFAAIAALALTACSNDDEIKVGGDNAILLTSSLNVAETRAATNIQTSAFDAGETVDVYITENNGGNNPTTYPQPIEYSTAAGGALTVGTQYYYPTSGNGVNIYALYPATAATGELFTIKEDQSADDNYKASDLMYGKPTTNPVSPSANAVNIQFSHLLSKVTINLIAGANVTSLDGAKVELLGVKPSTTLTAGINGHSITAASGDAASITVMTATETVTSGSAIIVPQTLPEMFLQVTLDGATLTGKLDSGTPVLTAGNAYTYNITVNMRGGALEIEGSITPWDDGGTDSGTVNPQ
jgi:hypothetical protein